MYHWIFVTSFPMGIFITTYILVQRQPFDPCDPEGYTVHLSTFVTSTAPQLIKPMELCTDTLRTLPLGRALCWNGRHSWPNLYHNLHVLQALESTMLVDLG